MVTRRELMVGVGILGMSSLARAETPAATKPAPGATAVPTGTVHDFDFLVGNWTSVNRRLEKRAVGSDDWDTFPSTLKDESRMGGVVNIDEVVFPTKGWAGMTVRTFDLETKRWSLYWINSKTGKLFPPVLGAFAGERGNFYGDDDDDGKPVKVHFLWTLVSKDLVRWQQAFSYDGGKSWETNWTVDHTRAK